MDKFNLQSMDARVWVKEFNRIEVERGLQPTDPEWMLGWFANAIMAGYDEAKRRIATPLEPIDEKELIKILKDHITTVSLYHDKECGNITQEHIIFEARFEELASAIRTSLGINND